MNVYVSYKKVLYSRIYEKIYNVMAVVGGFSQVVIMIIRIFCELMNVIKMRLSLINSCFYFDKIEMSKRKSKLGLAASYICFIALLGGLLWTIF